MANVSYNFLKRFHGNPILCPKICFRTVDTKLPPGDYCDVWSGELELNQCTGKTITVDHDGLISFFLNYLLIIFRFIWLFQLNLLTYP